MNDNQPVTLNWVNQMIDPTSFGHLQRSLNNDPAIGTLIEIVDPDLDLAEVGVAFFNGDTDSLTKWMNAETEALVQHNQVVDMRDIAEVRCIRCEPFYVFKRTGRQWV